MAANVWCLALAAQRPQCDDRCRRVSDLLRRRFSTANGSLRTTDFARPASSDLGLLAGPEHGSVSTAAGLLLTGGAEATNDADAPESISRPCDILDETACEARNNDPDAYQSVARAHQIPVPGSEREGRSFVLLGCVYTHASLGTG
jgi:hypothetical protein